MPREVRVIGPSQTLSDSSTAVQRTVNMDVVRIDADGEDSLEVLQSAPGMQLSRTIAGESFRAIYAAETMLLLFTVDGSGDMKVRDLAEGPSGTVYTLGLASGQPLIKVAHGQFQVVAVDGIKAWVISYSISGGIASIDSTAPITDVAYQGSLTVSHLDGYFSFIKPNSEQFYLSAIDNASDLSALDFSSADGSPDLLVAQIVADGILYLFGSRSVEPWVNTGASPFPFERVNGGRADIGCVGPHAVCKLSSGIAWVGATTTGGPHVYVMRGYTPQKISSRSVDEHLKTLASKELVSVWSYIESGIEFIGVSTRESGKTTWVHNSSTGKWCERGVFSGSAWGPYPIQYTAHINGLTYGAGISDGSDAKVYVVSSDYTNIGGDPMMRERTWPHLVHPEFEPISYHQLELRCTSGEDSDGGTITLEVSNDGGKSFLAPLSRDLGTVGKPVQRIRWMGLGSCPAASSRVFRLRSDSDGQLTIQAAALKATL